MSRPRRARATAAAPVAESRTDDWVSSTSSLGGVKDKHRGIGFGRRCRLTRETLEALYAQNPIAARIVDKIVDDAFREGWRLKSVSGPDASKVDTTKVRSDFDELGADTALSQSAKWSRLYGGGAVVIPALESGAPEQPFTFTDRTTLLRFVPVPEERIRPLEQDAGILSPTYGETLRWQIDGLVDHGVVVHHSRVIPFEPVKFPIEALRRLGPSANGWGPSVLERPFDDLARYGAVGAHAVSMMYNASILWLSMSGYRKEHATKEGSAKIRRSLEAIRANLDAFSLLGMDEGDKVGAVTLGTGSHELMDRTKDRLAAATEYPREVLFNESPAGLNAGELSGPQELYFGTVRAWWNLTIKPALDYMLELYFRTHELAIDSWELELLPLWTPSTKETSETHARNAVADQIYIEKGCLTAEQVTQQRFVEGNLGALTLSPDDVPEPLELDPADVQQHVAATTSAPSTDAVPDDVLTVQAAAVRFGIKTRSITTLLAKRRPDGTPVLRHWGFGTNRVVSLAEVAAAAAAKLPEIEPQDPADPHDQGAI